MTKYPLKEFSFDWGCDYYMIRFSNRKDYNHSVTQGPRLICENYLIIRKWVLNFIPDKEPIHLLTTWIQIACLSIEYHDNGFLHTMGKKIGRVLKIDHTTVAMWQGKFTQLSVQAASIQISNTWSSLEDQI